MGRKRENRNVDRIEILKNVKAEKERKKNGNVEREIFEKRKFVEKTKQQQQKKRERKCPVRKKFWREKSPKLEICIRKKNI